MRTDQGSEMHFILSQDNANLKVTGSSVVKNAGSDEWHDYQDAQFTLEGEINEYILTLVCKSHSRAIFGGNSRATIRIDVTAEETLLGKWNAHTVDTWLLAYLAR